MGAAQERRHLDLETEALVRLSASLATRNEDAIRGALKQTLESAPPAAVEEILLQSYLFLGFPAALEGLVLWREISGRSREMDSSDEGRTNAETPENVGSPGPSRSKVGSGSEGRSEQGTPSGRDELAMRMERGERTCRIVYGGRYEALRRNIRALHPEMERWMLEEGYGKVLSRRGLDLRVRELAIGAILAVLGTQVQLHSHLRGALHAGATPEEVEATLAVSAEYGTDEDRRAARQTWNRVRESKRRG